MLITIEKYFIFYANHNHRYLTLNNLFRPQTTNILIRGLNQEIDRTNHRVISVHDYEFFLFFCIFLFVLHPLSCLRELAIDLLFFKNYIAYLKEL